MDEDGKGNEHKGCDRVGNGEAGNEESIATEAREEPRLATLSILVLITLYMYFVCLLRCVFCLVMDSDSEAVRSP